MKNLSVCLAVVLPEPCSCTVNPVSGDVGFTSVSEAETDAIEIPRLRIVARGGETFATPARASALETDAEIRLRLLNRAFAKGNIKQLDRIKTVV